MEPLINPQTVIETSLDIIDRDGLDALSMRSLASALGVGAASLYHHFTDKDDIVDRVAKFVLDQNAAETVDRSGTWQDQFVTMSEGSFNTLVKHPNLLSVLARRSDRRFAVVQHNHAAKLALSNGVPPELVMPLLDALEGLLLGLALFESVPSVVPYDADGERFVYLTQAVDADAIEGRDRLRLAVRALLAGWISEVVPPANKKKPGRK